VGEAFSFDHRGEDAALTGEEDHLFQVKSIAGPGLKIKKKGRVMNHPPFFV
jgi:hypothetical protein